MLTAMQKLVFQRDIQYMVGRGYLEPPKGVRIMTCEDLSDVKQTKEGDFRETEVGGRECWLLRWAAFLWPDMDALHARRLACM